MRCGKPTLNVRCDLPRWRPGESRLIYLAVVYLPKDQSLAPQRFDPLSATSFVNKSVSEETRGACRLALSDFFQFVGGKRPSELLIALAGGREGGD